MPSHVLETSKRTPLYLTVAVLQLFVVEFLVAGTWRGHYSYSANFISDLGVPFCGTDGNAPCSKTSLLMDASFVVTGLATWLPPSSGTVSNGCCRRPPSSSWWWPGSAE